MHILAFPQPSRERLLKKSFNIGKYQFSCSLAHGFPEYTIALQKKPFYIIKKIFLTTQPEKGTGK
jgi:hypothetical protein